MLEAPPKISREQGSWVARLREGLAETRARVSGLFSDRAIDPGLFEELETALLASDTGIEATRFLLSGLRERARGLSTAAQLKSVLRVMLVELLAPLERGLDPGVR